MRPGRLGEWFPSSTRGLRMDDRLWLELWERNLGQVERRNVALAVWRRIPPGDPFAAIVGWELAHRWRTRARNLAVVYALWAVFWGALAWAGTRTDDGVVAMPLVMATGGLVALALCVAVRRRMRPVILGRTGFAPAAPLGSVRPGPVAD